MHFHSKPLNNQIEFNRVIVGDCQKEVLLVPDNSIDLVFTDPPWGIDFKYDNGYDDDIDSYIPLVDWIVNESNRILKPGSFAFVHQATKRLKETWSRFPDDSRLFSVCKTFIQLNRIPVEYAVDYIVYWQKPGKFQLPGLNKDWIVAQTSITTKGSRGIDKQISTSPPRPLDSTMGIINGMCPIGGVVADFFMGSGTTGLACKQLGRNFWGCEIDGDTAKFANDRISKAKIPLIQTTDIFTQQEF